jgi:hypothetical protein
MNDDYSVLTAKALLSNLSQNPPDTPIWINSRVELERRREEQLSERTASLSRWTRVLAISTIVLVICTAADVLLHLKGR